MCTGNTPEEADYAGALKNRPWKIARVYTSNTPPTKATRFSRDQSDLTVIDQGRKMYGDVTLCPLSMHHHSFLVPTGQEYVSTGTGQVLLTQQLIPHQPWQSAETQQ